MQRLDSTLGIVQSGAWKANLGRMLDELVNSQFADPRLAIRENVQNARDARPRTGVYAGMIGNQNIYIVDDGSGMNKHDIAEHLLGLFQSSKADDQDAIGRFGIGRLANLKIADVLVYDTKRADGKPITVAITGKLHNGDSYQIYQFPGSRDVEGTSVVMLVKDEYAKELKEDSVRQILTGECGWISAPLYFEGEQINKPFDIESPRKLAFEEDGIRGVIGIPQGFRQVSLLQRGIKVTDEYFQGIINGLVDSQRLNPVIGRAGVVKDAEYQRTIDLIRGKILELGAQIAENPSLTEREVIFLRELVDQYFTYGDRVHEDWGSHTFPESIRRARIFPTIFGKNLLSAIGEGGSIDNVERYMKSVPDSELEHVSLEQLAVAGKDHIFYSPIRTQVAEDLREDRNIVVKSDERGIIDTVVKALGLYYRDIKPVQKVEQDIDIRPYEPNENEQALLRLFEDFGVKNVRFGDVRKIDGRKDERSIAAHASKEGIVININSPYVQKIIELTQYPESRVAAQLLMYPVLGHEEAHGVLGTGAAHTEEFHYLHQLIMEKRSMEYANKLLNRLKHGITDGEEVLVENRQVLEQSQHPKKDGLVDRVVKFLHLR